MTRKHALVWDSRGLVAIDPATGSVYDLTKGVNRIPLARHIMSLLPSSMSIKDLLKKAGISKTYELWFQVIQEHGEDLIEAYQIISIGKVLGMSDWEILSGAYASQKQMSPLATRTPVLDSPVVTYVVEVPAPKHEPCEAEAYADGPEPLWNADDSRGLFPNRKSFDLRGQDMRYAVYKRIKARNPYQSIDELFRHRSTSWMRVKWFENVGSGFAPIHGSQLESIAKAIDASLYWLVFGEYGTSEAVVEEASPVIERKTVAVVEKATPIEAPRKASPPKTLPAHQVIVIAPPPPIIHPAPAVAVVVLEPELPAKEVLAKAELDIFSLDLITKPEERILDVDNEPTEVVVAEDSDPSVIVWDKSNTIATYQKRQFDLSDKELRSLIADRIRFAKGFMTYGELSSKAKLKNRQPSWLSTLTLLTRKELEAIAKACTVSTNSLLTGNGITMLASSESATSWLKRYQKESPEGNVLVAMTDELYEQLSALHPAVAHQLVELLAERLRT